tara:strand:+ start:101 stop:955 length:855 start_codon:yes stop_codon:yes gene_type:complete
MKKFYFAYGSNLNIDDLREYEKRKNKVFVDTINILDGIFFLPDYELQFPVKSPTRKGGVLDVTPNIGHAVAGKLFEIDDWGLLDKKEGSPYFYKPIDITVIDENGKTFDAITYVVNSEKQEGYQKPHEDYVRVVSEGYANFKILEKFPWAHENLISASANKQCSMIDIVFVYGTLKKGQCREQSMNEISLGSKDEKVTAKMYNIGEFPAITLEKGVVLGEIHRVKKEQESIESLDQIEGFVGYGKSSLYNRILINSRQGICWTYVWNRDIDAYPVIKSGNWDER